MSFTFFRYRGKLAEGILVGTQHQAILWVYVCFDVIEDKLFEINIAEVYVYTLKAIRWTSLGRGKWYTFTHTITHLYTG